MSKIYFQGTFGAYSHIAALEIEPKSEIIPCKTFDECFLKASTENDSKIVIPESNRITGNIGIEYLMFKYRLNIYAEYFLKIEHNLLGQPGTSISDIRDVFSHAQALSQCSKFIKKNNFPTAVNFIRGNSLIDNQNIYHHIGIYSYKISALEKFVRLDQTHREKKNKLEQLRALDNKLKINVALAKSSPIGVDTEEDYLALKKIMEYKLYNE